MRYQGDEMILALGYIYIYIYMQPRNCRGSKQMASNQSLVIDQALDYLDPFDQSIGVIVHLNKGQYERSTLLIERYIREAWTVGYCYGTPKLILGP